MSLFRTIICPDANVALARQLCALESGGAGMLISALSADGLAPATHYISSGECPPVIVQFCPVQTWEQQDGVWVMTDSTPGDPQAVVDAAKAADPPVPCTLTQVKTLFKKADITEQDPWVALGRLGLKLVQESIDG